MTILRILCVALLATGLPLATAYAQDDDRPLIRTTPPIKGFPAANPGDNAAPAATPQASVATSPASSNPAQAASVATAQIGNADDVRAANNARLVARSDDATDSCDAVTDNKTQVHGSVSTGVVAGNHVSGNYESGTVNITKPLGDCKDPDKFLSITIHVSQSRIGASRSNH